MLPALVPCTKLCPNGHAKAPARNLRFHPVRSWNSSLPLAANHLAHIEAGHPTALTACNGAGKTSTVLVAAALWCLFNWPLARIIVTSASWSQLKKQFFDTIRTSQRHPLFRSHIFNEAEVGDPPHPAPAALPFLSRAARRGVLCRFFRCS